MNNYCLSLSIFCNHTVRFNIFNNFYSVFTAQLIKYCQTSLIKSSFSEVSADSSQC